MDASHPLEPADEKAWLARKAEIYRKLSLAQRIAWFRDLEWLVQAVAGEKAKDSRDGEPDVAQRWRDPLAGMKS